MLTQHFQTKQIHPQAGSEIQTVGLQPLVLNTQRPSDNSKGTPLFPCSQGSCDGTTMNFLPLGMGFSLESLKS